jgi:regulator of replication initiation timing
VAVVNEVQDALFALRQRITVLVAELVSLREEVAQLRAELAESKRAGNP